MSLIGMYFYSVNDPIPRGRKVHKTVHSGSCKSVTLTLLHHFLDVKRGVSPLLKVVEPTLTTKKGCGYTHSNGKVM